MADTNPQMPFGKINQKINAPATLPPLGLPPGGPGPAPAGAPLPLPPPPMQPPAGTPPAMPQGPMAPPMPAGPQNPFPSPTAPAAPPYQVALQADGSAKFFIPSPDGNAQNDVIIGLAPPPKTPKAFQAPNPQPPAK